MDNINYYSGLYDVKEGFHTFGNSRDAAEELFEI